MHKTLAAALFATASLAFVSLSFSSAGADIQIPMPSQTAAVLQNVPNHILNMEQISGSTGKNSCWHVNDADAFNGACNRPPITQPTAGPGGTATDMTTLAKYTDYVETNAGGGEEYFANAGIKTVIYEDAAIIHNGFTGFIGPGTGGSIGHNPPSQISTAPCMFTAGQLPPYLLLNARTYSNALYWLVNEGATCTSNNGGAFYGDVNPQAVSYWANALDVLNHKNQNGQGGFTYPYSAKSVNSNFSVVWWDDHDYPGHRLTGAYGTCVLQTPVTFTTLPASCAAISRTQATIGDNPYFSQRINNAADDMNPGWVDGSRNLFRMPARFGMQSFFNDAYDPTQLKHLMVPDRANLMGVMCENCMGRNGANLWTLNTWENHINTEIVANSWGVKFIAKTPQLSSIADDVYVTASEWQGLMYPTGLIEMGQGYGTTNSGVEMSPLTYITPTQPLTDSPNLVFDPFKINYNIYSAPTGYGVATAQRAGGAFVREFAHCYIGSSSSSTPRDIGACASVVFPVAGTFPTLVGSYANSWTYTGAGIIAETQFGGGDTGALSHSASIPTAGTSEPVGAAFILTANN